MGILLLSAPTLAGTALVYLLAAWFLVDAARLTRRALRARRANGPFAAPAAAALGNFAVGGMLALLGAVSPAWAVSMAGALRIFGTAWNIAMSPVFDASDAGETVVRDLGLGQSSVAAALAERLEDEERTPAAVRPALDRNPDPDALRDSSRSDGFGPNGSRHPGAGRGGDRRRLRRAPRGSGPRDTGGPSPAPADARPWQTLPSTGSQGRRRRGDGAWSSGG